MSNLFVLIIYPYLLLVLVPWIVRLATRPSRRLPPGPRRLPVIGNLHQLGELPHQSLKRLSDKHGPLMYVHMGQVPTVVVSSPKMAEEFLRTNDIMFCTRPRVIAPDKLSYGGLDMAFAVHGNHWRQAKKISTFEFFNAKRCQSFRGLREDEVDIMVRAISRSSSASLLINLNEMLHSFLINVICRAVFGKRASGDGEEYGEKNKSLEIISEATELMGGFCLGDFFPSMEWLNVFTGLHRRLERNSRELDMFLEHQIEECMDAAHAGGNSTPGPEQTGFLSVLLRLQDDPSLATPLSRDHIKGLLMDMFVAGTDSSATTIEWGMAELMKNPRVMNATVEEIRSVIGKKERVEESDLHQLQYLKLVVKEILRLHPPGSLLLPRECREECKIDGYDIPSKTRLFINAWAVGRDPDAWDDPEKFWPERFQDNDIDYRGHHFQLIPFGAGRRMCPGISFAEPIIELALSNLLHRFHWELPRGMNVEEIDMTESYGVVIHRKSPLHLMATPTSIGY